MLTVTFLGTSAARPTVERNVSGLAIHREGETLLFECGEGTQRQMMRYGVSFALSEIFFTHFHADHFLGVIGLIRTLGLQGRPEPLFLYGPKGAKKVLGDAMKLGVERVPFPIEITEVKPGEVIVGEGRREKDAYEIRAFPTEHGGGSIGYALKEHERRVGKEGPMWGKIAKGEMPGPEGVVGPPRRGRVVVFTGDTRPSASTVDAAKGADLLIHEATFGEEEKDRAKETGHSTAQEAAQVALAAGVKKLVLCHVSARYSMSADELVKEAREIFPAVFVARDGQEVDVPFAD